MPRHLLLIAMTVACVAQKPTSTLAPRAPSATVRQDGAVLVLPAAASLWGPVVELVSQAEAQLQWIIGWGRLASVDWADFNLFVAVPRAVRRPAQPDRLVRRARTEYDRLEPAGSITAIVMDRTPNAAVEWDGEAIVIRWGPSSGLSQLLADRPDSLRVTMTSVPEGSVERFWLWPMYGP